jgi:hypothetical protein
MDAKAIYVEMDEEIQEYNGEMRRDTHSDKPQTSINPPNQPLPLPIPLTSPHNVLSLRLLHIQLKLHRRSNKHNNEKLLDTNTTHINMYSFHNLVFRGSRRSPRTARELDGEGEDVKADEEEREVVRFDV